MFSLPERRSQVHNETLSRRTSWTSSVYDESGLERRATLTKIKKLPGQSAKQQQYIYSHILYVHTYIHTYIRKLCQVTMEIIVSCYVYFILIRTYTTSTAICLKYSNTQKVQGLLKYFNQLFKPSLHACMHTYMPMQLCMYKINYLSVPVNLLYLSNSYLYVRTYLDHRPTSFSEEDNLITLDEDYPEDTSGN